MTESEQNGSLDNEMERLSGRIDTMLRLCEELRVENQSLRSQRDQLTAERARLVERLDTARNRVDAMVSRLKALEQET
jgi:cell division protein ZapB